MHDSQPLHHVSCSFCGTSVPCWCRIPRDHRLWCQECEQKHFMPGHRLEAGPVAPDLSHPNHKSWFLADLALCRQHLHPHLFIPICDMSIRSLLITPVLRLRHLPHVSSALGVLDHVPSWEAVDLERVVRAQANLVWVSVGTQFGSPLDKALARGTIPEGRLVALAGTSPLSGCYAGIRLYRVLGRKYGQRVAQFRAGVVHLEGPIAEQP